MPVAIFLTENGRLPSLWGLFDLYAGPWSSESADDRVVTLLVAYAGVVLVAGLGSGRPLWRMRRAGAVLNLALLPVEAVFWVGFALPIPWVFGIARAALVVAAWPELAGARGREAAATPRRRARSPQVREFLTCGFVWWPGAGSNRRPSDFQSDARTN